MIFLLLFRLLQKKIMSIEGPLAMERISHQLSWTVLSLNALRVECKPPETHFAQIKLISFLCNTVFNSISDNPNCVPKHNGYNEICMRFVMRVLMMSALDTSLEVEFRVWKTLGNCCFTSRALKRDLVLGCASTDTSKQFIRTFHRSDVWHNARGFHWCHLLTDYF